MPAPHDSGERDQELFHPPPEAVIRFRAAVIWSRWLLIRAWRALRAEAWATTTVV